MSEAPTPSRLKRAAIAVVIAGAAWAAIAAPTVYDPATAAGRRAVCTALDCALHPTPKGHPMSDARPGRTPMKETEALNRENCGELTIQAKTEAVI